MYILQGTTSSKLFPKEFLGYLSDRNQNIKKSFAVNSHCGHQKLPVLHKNYSKNSKSYSLSNPGFQKNRFSKEMDKAILTWLLILINNMHSWGVPHLLLPVQLAQNYNTLLSYE